MGASGQILFSGKLNTTLKNSHLKIMFPCLHLCSAVVTMYRRDIPASLDYLNPTYVFQDSPQSVSSPISSPPGSLDADVSSPPVLYFIRTSLNIPFLYAVLGPLMSTMCYVWSTQCESPAGEWVLWHHILTCLFCFKHFLCLFWFKLFYYIFYQFILKE